MDIWTLIVKSNTFNFVIFMMIIIFVAQKIDIPAALTSLQEKIAKMIKDVESAKENSINTLKNAENSFKNVGDEVKIILSDAENTAKKLAEKILEDAKKQVLGIELNAERVINAEEKKLCSLLSKKTSLASLQLAENHIKSTLEDKPQLHAKFIKDSIDELDGLKF